MAFRFRRSVIYILKRGGGGGESRFSRSLQYLQPNFESNGFSVQEKCNIYFQDGGGGGGRGGGEAVRGNKRQFLPPHFSISSFISGHSPTCCCIMHIHICSFHYVII